MRISDWSSDVCSSDLCEMILMLAPETNGEVAVKAWEALGKMTGRDHVHLAEGKEEEKIRFRDVVAQPRKIISSPIWSGLESEHVCSNAGYTNVHRSEEHTSELQSLIRISYAFPGLNKKTQCERQN